MISQDKCQRKEQDYFKNDLYYLETRGKSAKCSYINNYCKYDQRDQVVNDRGTDDYPPDS